jgi:hypothetical protein
MGKLRVREELGSKDKQNDERRCEAPAQRHDMNWPCPYGFSDYVCFGHSGLLGLVRR